MSLLKKLASETALYGLSSIIGRLVTFVFLTPYLTRKFLPDEMGIQTDIYAWAAFFMIIFTFRMETAFFRFGNKAENRWTAFRTALTAVGTVAIGLGLTLTLFSQPLANALEYPNHPEYIICFALILALDAGAAIPFALLRLEGRAKKFAVVKLANLFIHLGSILFFLEIAPNYFPSIYSPNVGIGYVFLANLLASFSTFALLLPHYFLKKEEDENTEEEQNWGFDKALFAKMRAYALPLVVAGFAGIINEVLDRVLLKWMLVGSIEERLYQVGIYGACYKISIFMSLFTQAFNYAAEPFFFKNAERSDSKEIYADVTYLFTLVGCTAFLGVTLFMDIAQYFVAESYRVGLVVVPILLLANLCLGLFYNVSIWFKLSNKTIAGAYIAIIGATITILFNIILIPYLGYVGSAWTTLLCYAGMTSVAYIWGQRIFPIPYAKRRILVHILFAVSIYIIYNQLTSLLHPPIWLSLLFSVIFLGIYWFIVFLSEGKRIKRILARQ